MVTLKILCWAISIGLFGLAAFLAQTPWRVHGGRFITEYLMLAGGAGLIGLIILTVGLLIGPHG
jgi:hypothetical protein